MREIIVSEKCMGCGQCIMGTDYLQETADGTAEFVKGKDIPDDAVAQIQKIIEECPVNALSFKESSATSQKGVTAIKEIITKLEKDLEQVNIPRITESNIPFNPKDYYIPTPFSRHENDARYKSESQARSEARSEFEKLLYSESAFRPMIKKVFVEYKVNVLKPYYTYENSPKSYYYKFNEQYAQKLRVYYSDIMRATDHKAALSEEWKEFEIYPAKGTGRIEDEVDPVRFFDNRSTSSGIMTQMRSDQYTSLNYYVDSMDYDYIEEYAGEGLFGSKTKEKWYYSGFSSAASEFIKDLMDAMRYADPGIEGSGERVVNDTIGIYEYKVKDALRKRISDLKKLL